MNDQGEAEQWPTDWQHFKWRLRNPWTWPGLLQIGCWWEERRYPGQWREGMIVLRYPDTPSRRAEGEDL